MDWSFVLIVICAILVLGLCVRAKICIDKGRSSNHASYSVSVGVLFTFIGITLSLLGFNIADSSSPDVMVKSVTAFLDGMKLAFITSVIGMIGSFIIKSLQRNCDQAEIQNEQAALTNLDTLCKQNDAIIATLKKIDENLSESSNAALATKLQSLTVAIKENNIASNQQTEILKDASDKQINELNKLADIFRGSVEEQSKQLSESTSRLDNVSDKFTQMADDTREMLKATQAFHSSQEKLAQESLSNMRDNTQKMEELTKAFNQFLNDMSEKFSDNFINSLRECIKNLNDNLKEQFGENFKRLDEAVGKLNTWQQENKEELDRLTVAYGEVHNSYRDFVEKQQVTNEYIERFKALLAEFQALIERTTNEELKNLNTLVFGLSATIEQANKNIEQGSVLHEQMSKNLRISNETAERGNSLVVEQKKIIAKYGDTMQETTKNIANEFAELRRSIRSDIADSMQQLKTRNDELAKEAADALEAKYKELTEKIGAYTVTIENKNTEVMNATHNFAEAMDESSKAVGTGAASFSSAWSSSIEEINQKMQEDIQNINKQLVETQNDFNNSLATSLAAVAEKIADKYDDVATAIDKINGIMKNSR